jgi:ribosomal protein L11 methylase PrmA
LILSGILPDQVDRVAAQYSAIHFELPLEASGWIRLTGRARGG